MSKRPLSGARLYSLIGDTLHDLPAEFVEKLERMLESNGMADPDSGRVVYLSQTGRAREGHVMLASGKVRGLEAILELLHAAHLERQDVADGPVLPAHLVEGLLAGARELLG
ncbi:hypothetical protein [Stenotrophomonas tumulicola]|uniref:Uncharacterized protein n=1 Tax=Stenotrophomonas tumulicola TaxID=1685415 RepID=A0A7W3FMD9_9GAMM|nr:hypothetical protein [Stenotrophomonas tumulicola]MBA8682232.1 hypothetical protein [Stenotrophomonas tumulicola]